MLISTRNCLQTEVLNFDDSSLGNSDQAQSNYELYHFIINLPIHNYLIIGIQQQDSQAVE
jgi:hypothetical protein